MSKSKATLARETEAREAASARLREIFPVGSSVPVTIKHVSRSGMLRVIAVLAPSEHDGVRDVSHLVADATGFKYDGNHGGVRVGGCGMDMGFHLVYSLASVLYRDGMPCTGIGHWPTQAERAAGARRCGSNDHANGDRDYTPGHIHSDPGYALDRHWI